MPLPVVDNSPANHAVPSRRQDTDKWYLRVGFQPVFRLRVLNPPHGNLLDHAGTAALAGLFPSLGQPTGAPIPAPILPLSVLERADQFDLADRHRPLIRTPCSACVGHSRTTAEPKTG